MDEDIISNIIPSIWSDDFLLRKVHRTEEEEDEFKECIRLGRLIQSVNTEDKQIDEEEAIFHIENKLPSEEVDTDEAAVTTETDIAIKYELNDTYDAAVATEEGIDIKNEPIEADVTTKANIDAIAMEEDFDIKNEQIDTDDLAITIETNIDIKNEQTETEETKNISQRNYTYYSKPLIKKDHSQIVEYSRISDKKLSKSMKCQVVIYRLTQTDRRFTDNYLSLNGHTHTNEKVNFTNKKRRWSDVHCSETDSEEFTGICGPPRKKDKFILDELHSTVEEEPSSYKHNKTSSELISIRITTGINKPMNNSNRYVPNSENNLSGTFSPSKISVLEIYEDGRTTRKYNRLQRPCLYCQKYVKDLSAHFKTVHKNEPEILKIKLERNLKKRKSLFAKLRKIGCYNENKKRLGTNEALLVERSIMNPQKLAHCLECKGYFAARSIANHVQRCLKNKEGKGKGYSSVIMSNCQELPKFHPSFKDIFLETLHKNSDYDELTKDFEILYVGNYLYCLLTAKQKPIQSSRDQISTVMRNLVKLKKNFNLRLKLEMEDNNLEICDISDIFHCHYFDTLQIVIRDLIFKKDADNNLEKLKDGSAISYHNSIMKAINGLQKMYTIKKDSEEKLQTITNFLPFYERNKALIYESIDVVSLEKRTINRMSDKLPLRKEIALVTNACLKSVEEFTCHFKILDSNSFIELRRACLTALVLFNGRKPFQVANVTIKQWELAKNKSFLPADKLATANDFEKKLLDNNLALFNTGKRSEIPLLVPKAYHKALDLLSDATNREFSKILKDNTYLFASIKGSEYHTDGSNEVQQFIKSQNLNIHLTSLQNRHMVHSEMNIADCPEETQKILAKFLGQTEVNVDTSMESNVEQVSSLCANTETSDNTAESPNNPVKKKVCFKWSMETNNLLIQEFGKFIDNTQKSYPDNQQIDQFFVNYPQVLNELQSVKEKKTQLRTKLNNMKRLQASKLSRAQRQILTV